MSSKDWNVKYAPIGHSRSPRAWKLLLIDSPNRRQLFNEWILGYFAVMIAAKSGGPFPGAASALALRPQVQGPREWMSTEDHHEVLVVFGSGVCCSGTRRAWSSITERSSAARSRAGSLFSGSVPRTTRHPAPAQFPLAAPAGKDSGADDRAGRRRQSRALRSGDLEVRHRLQSARRARRSGIRSS